MSHSATTPASTRKVTTSLLLALVSISLIGSAFLPSLSSRVVTFANAAPSSSSSYVGEIDGAPLEFFKRSSPSGKSAKRVEPPRSNKGNDNRGKTADRNGGGSNNGRKQQEGSRGGNGNSGNRGGSNNSGNVTCNNVGSLERQVADLKNDMARLTQLMEQMARQLSTCNLCQNGGNRGNNGGGNNRGRNMKEGNGKGNRNHAKKGGKRGGGSKKHKKGRGKEGRKGGNGSGKKSSNGGNQNGGGGGQQQPPSKTVVVTAVLSNIGSVPTAAGGASTMAAMDEAEVAELY